MPQNVRPNCSVKEELLKTCSVPWEIYALVPLNRSRTLAEPNSSAELFGFGRTLDSGSSHGAYSSHFTLLRPEMVLQATQKEQ